MGTLPLVTSRALYHSIMSSVPAIMTITLTRWTWLTFFPPLFSPALWLCLRILSLVCFCQFFKQLLGSAPEVAAFQQRGM